LYTKPGSQKAEVGGSQVQAQPGLQSKTLSQKLKKAANKKQKITNIGKDVEKLEPS
jgi:hypothetical protein